MGDHIKVFTQWVLDEAEAGREYKTYEEASDAFEAAGYSWREWVKGMNPTVNINGTSGEELLRQVSAVLAGLRTAEKAMIDASPHGRDYQHDASGDDYRAARAEHITRLSTIRALIRWYEAQQENIDNQVLERNAARSARMAR